MPDDAVELVDLALRQRRARLVDALHIVNCGRDRVVFAEREEPATDSLDPESESSSLLVRDVQRENAIQRQSLSGSRTESA